VTRQEKYEFLASLGFGIVLYLLSRSLVFAVFLPLGVFVFYTLARRARGASWLVRRDAEEVYYRKPQALRVLNAILALMSVALFAGLCYLSATSGGKGYPSFVPFGLLVFALMALLFTWGAGPLEMRFDLARGRVRYRAGLPMLARWQTRDAADIATLSVLSSKGTVMMTIRWKSRRGLIAGTTVSLSSSLDGSWATGGAEAASEEARASAELIGNRLGVPVEVRQIGQGMASR
jgi:hypothetical protein